MKKGMLTASLLAVVILAGCGIDLSNNHRSSGAGRLHDATQDVTYNGPSRQIKNHSPSDGAGGAFGYIHYSRKPGREHALSPQYVPRTDYRALADIITRVALTLPDIYDTGTLVTDKYILISYKSDSKNRQQAAAQVKATALSVVPNYYRVYVTDNPTVASEIANFKDLNTNTSNVHQWLDHLINRMKQSPQGNLTKNNVKNQGMDETERPQEQNMRINDVPQKK